MLPSESLNGSDDPALMRIVAAVEAALAAVPEAGIAAVLVAAAVTGLAGVERVVAADDSSGAQQDLSVWQPVIRLAANKPARLRKDQRWGRF